MLEGRRAGRRFQGLAVERAFQNRFDTAVRTSVGDDGPLRRGFQTWVRIALAQPQNAQAGAVAHLGVGLACENGGEPLRGERSHGLGPGDEARGRPSQMLLMALGAMGGNRRRLRRLMAARVGSDALPAVEDLEGGGGGTDFHLLPGEGVRHAVEVAIQLDVVVDVDARLGPVMELEALRGQKGARAGWSSSAKSVVREPGRLRKGRWLSFSNNSRIAWLSSARLKKRRWRNAATIQRSTTNTAFSTLALSRGL
jgi:hypothetical protein